MRIRTNLSRANLSGCWLRGAVLDEADLRDAVLAGASLFAAHLFKTNLWNADLRSATLDDCELNRCALEGVLVDEDTVLGGTKFINVQLASFCRVESKHRGPSFVDPSSIVLSFAEPDIKRFLRSTGMPDVFVEYSIDCARSLQPGEILRMFQSTFISYGGPDEEFARKLARALRSRGVTTFFFRDDAPPGERIHHVMSNGVNEYDRVILICSRSSLDRAGLQHELEETLGREARDGGATYLLPIRIDDYVLNGWTPERKHLARAVRDRVIADFTNHQDADAFSTALAKLLSILKAPPRSTRTR